jgi:hypothetical protein
MKRKKSKVRNNFFFPEQIDGILKNMPSSEYICLRCDEGYSCNQSNCSLCKASGTVFKRKEAIEFLINKRSENEKKLREQNECFR